LLEVDGETALVVRFAAIDSAARYEAALALGSLRLLRNGGSYGD
jgi:hypothetical protein